jgi:murein DD-endopeptidase MepM/ murein hydrolase activator NlpD
MAVITENQNISKRKTLNLRPNNKSAGFNSGFMNQFKQNPVRTGRKKIKYNNTTQEKPSKMMNVNAGKSGFSFSIPSPVTLAIIAGTVLIALAALNWEDLNIKTPESYAFQPSTDSNTEKYTIRYAATGISGMMIEQPVLVPVENLSENSTAPATPVINEDSNLQNDLITFKWQQYKVKKGDSVSEIAKKYKVSIGAVIASNEISNARRLQEGAVLRIPNIDGIPYKIKKGDNLSKIAASFNVPLEVILDINDIKSDTIRAGENLFIPGARMNDIDLKLSLGDLFISPVQNKYITSNYGMRKDPINGQLTFHTGIDLRANTGTTVMAAMDGIISIVSENWLYGKHIIISHSNGYKTLYAHLNSFSVKQGEKAVRGRKIGEVGNTGYSTGPHLHFGIYNKSGNLVNPIDLLN